ncbi:MAG: nitronate monooxygenase [Deltaproteobacteria bacterium]|nr:nitronate monooxygenase [Deltaproteobacteria bacterium]
MGDKGLHTKLCDMLGIEYPVILAGMGRVSGAELVAAVSNAGGLGVLGASVWTLEEMRAEIRKVKELTDKPFGVDLLFPGMAQSPPSGQTGTITTSSIKSILPKEQLDFVESLKVELGLPEVEVEVRIPTVMRPKESAEILFEEEVPFFVSGLGFPEWLEPEAHAHGMKMIHLVGNVRNARRAAQAGADIIVAQGTEAGGHTGRIGTLTLVPQVVDAVYPLPVVAAGGIGDGRGLAAVLALGACGALVGTRFVASKESREYEFQKQKIVAATEEDTRVTRIYSGKTLRAINNKLIETWDRSEISTLPMPLQSLLTMELMEGLLQAEMTDYLSGLAGQISGMITEVKSAAEIMEDIVSEADEVLGSRLPHEISITS